ncbi:MAG: hypothetical protein H7A52_17045 [Akkermansiaceae bacterium]|nr:hypothetical protein [Akkermansiaceae bacterium]
MTGHSTAETVHKAFVLGAGLGNRLRPLTERVPKPLIPVWNRPLIAWAFDHLIADAGCGAFMVNTHHCPEVYGETFPGGVHRGRAVAFRHEPVLLDTAGGIANVADWLPDRGSGESFFVYNGDILTDLPLGPAIATHRHSDFLVTMVLRREGAALQVAWDEASGAVADIRGMLGRGGGLPRFQFTGIYLVRAAFLDFLTPGKIESVVLPFLEAIRSRNGVGGVVIDEGRWSDLGSRRTYLDATLALADGAEPAFPRYGAAGGGAVRIHPGAHIDPSARICPRSVVGAGAEVGAGARVTESILWPDSRVEAGASLRDCVVRTGQAATGKLAGADL